MYFATNRQKTPTLYTVAVHKPQIFRQSVKLCHEPPWRILGAEPGKFSGLHFMFHEVVWLRLGPSAPMWATGSVRGRSVGKFGCRWKGLLDSDCRQRRLQSSFPKIGCFYLF